MLNTLDRLAALAMTYVASLRETWRRSNPYLLQVIKRTTALRPVHLIDRLRLHLSF